MADLSHWSLASLRTELRSLSRATLLRDWVTDPDKKRQAQQQRKALTDELERRGAVAPVKSRRGKPKSLKIES